MRVAKGELIFRYIYEAADCEKPIQRLWISSLTPEAIRNGFETLRPGSEYVPLADAACGRSRADWLVGMNLSRAYSIAYNEELSVGRVQTPTLAMMVERELAIRKFVPEKLSRSWLPFTRTARLQTARIGAPGSEPCWRMIGAKTTNASDAAGCGRHRGGRDRRTSAYGHRSKLNHWNPQISAPFLLCSTI